MVENILLLYYVEFSMFAGVALYLAWVSCATSLNTVIVLHYIAGIDIGNACIALLVILNVILIAWFICEIVFDKQLR